MQGPDGTTLEMVELTCGGYSGKVGYQQLSWRMYAVGCQGRCMHAYLPPVLLFSAYVSCEPIVFCRPSSTRASSVCRNGPCWGLDASLSPTSSDTKSPKLTSCPDRASSRCETHSLEAGPARRLRGSARRRPPDGQQRRQHLPHLELWRRGAVGQRANHHAGPHQAGAMPGGCCALAPAGAVSAPAALFIQGEKSTA